MKKSQCGNAGDVTRDRDIHWKLIGSRDSTTSRTFVSNVGEWMWQVSIQPNEFTHRLWRNSAVSLDVPSDWRFFSNVTTRGKGEMKTFRCIIQINSSDPDFKGKSLKYQFKTNHWNRLFKQAHGYRASAHQHRGAHSITWTGLLPLALIWKILDEVSLNTSCSSDGLTCVAVKGHTKKT